MLLLAAWVSHALAKSRDRTKAIDEARAKFRSAFAEELADLTRRQTDPFALLKKATVAHDSAIVAFRPLVEKSRLEAFDNAVTRFHHLRSSTTPAMLAALEQRATGSTGESASTSDLVHAIQELLIYAAPR